MLLESKVLIKINSDVNNQENAGKKKEHDIIFTSLRSLSLKDKIVNTLTRTLQPTFYFPFISRIKDSRTRTETRGLDTC